MAKGVRNHRGRTKDPKEDLESTAPTTADNEKLGQIVSPRNAPNLLLFGIAGLLLSLAIVFIDRALTPIQVAVLALILGLSGAAVATAISGILRLETKVLVAGGPFVIFVLAFWAVMSAGAPGVLPSFGVFVPAQSSGSGR